MADIGLSAFSIFFMGSPSFLAHQRALEEGHGRSNCETLFGMSTIPSDNYIRLMLDGAAPAAFDPLFFKAIEAAGPLTPFQCLGGRTLIALDGTEHFCSRKIKCRQCSTRRRSDGGTQCFHTFLGASLVAPGHRGLAFRINLTVGFRLRASDSLDSKQWRDNRPGRMRWKNLERAGKALRIRERAMPRCMRSMTC